MNVEAIYRKAPALEAVGKHGHGRNAFEPKSAMVPIG